MYTDAVSASYKPISSISQEQDHILQLVTVMSWGFCVLEEVTQYRFLWMIN